MILFNALIIYVISVYVWTWILWLLRNFLISFQVFLSKKFKNRQMSHLLNEKIPKLVKSIKLEMFLEDKLNKITPSLPFRDEKHNSDEDLQFEVNKNYHSLLFYLKRLSPFRISSLIFIILIIRFYLHIGILNYIFRLITWKSIKSITQIGNPLPFIAPSIALILLLCALYFIKEGGVFRKAKNKIRVEEIENKIKFHKENQILLANLLVNGYRNVDIMIKGREYIISEIEEYKEKNIDFEMLKNLEVIEELNKFVQESNNKNRDLDPFRLGTSHASFIHISFFELHWLYRKNNIIADLNAIFLTKQHMESVITTKRNLSENYINHTILESIKTVVMIHKYLDIIHNLINKPTTIYSFFAFIINKDK